MAVKGKKRAAGQDAHPSPSKKSKAKADGGGQTALDSFFASPSRPKPGAQPLTNGKAKEDAPKVARPEIIALSDSDDDGTAEGNDDEVPKCAQQLDEDDEAMAIRLATEDGIDVEELRRKERELATPLKAKERSPPTPLGPMLGSSSNKPASSRPPRPSVPADPLDKDIFSFDPASIDTSDWPLRSGSSSPFKGKAKAVPGEGGVATPYAFLVKGFGLITSTRSRLYITTVMTNMLRTIIHHDPASLLQAVYLITNHIAPAYEGVELGVGSQVLGKALKATTTVSPKELRALWHKYGDPGDVAFHARASVRTLFPSPPLTLSSLFAALVRLSTLGGKGTVQTKADVCQKLLIASKGEETRYLVRTICRNLRIGAVRLTVTAALARAFCLTRPSSSAAGEKAYWVDEGARKGIVAVSEKKGKQKTEVLNRPARLEAMATLGKAEKLVRMVYVRHPNYNDIIPALLEGGLEDLRERVPLAVGTPLSPMLGQITRDLSDVAGRLGVGRPFVAEWKYDGQRVQIHARLRRSGEQIPKEYKEEGRGGKWVGEGRSVFVRLFSRHLEDMTDKYPDILALIPLLLRSRDVSNGAEEQWPQPDVESFVLDAEVCAIDPATGQLQTFQTLANRARKDVKIGEVKVRVGIFAFDLMYLNGKSLLTEPFRERRGLLKRLLPPKTPEDPTVARFDHVASMEGTVAELDEVKEFMGKAIASKCEGIMVKVLDHEDGVDVKRIVEISDDEEEEDELDVDKEAGEGEEEGGKKGGAKGRRKALLASYEPDKRADSWLKVKKDYGELGDSLDLVPIGAWHGQGRKAGWWSPILLALYNPDSGGFQAVCKCISGFTDQFYKDLNVRYVKGTDRCSTEELAYVEPGGHVPDVWFLPSEVWEIRGADLTLSPVYKAALGLVDEDRGLSLRFPRFYKLRDDKGIEEALHPDEFAALYRTQEGGRIKEPPVEDLVDADAMFDD